MLLRQQELLHVWDRCLERVLQPVGPNYEPDGPEYDPGHDPEYDAEYDPDHDADARARGRAAAAYGVHQLVATQYNGLLRRLWGASEVLLCVKNALRATLPARYRWSRAVNHLLLGSCWIRWRLLPDDWRDGGRQQLRWRGGKHGRAALLEAERFDLDGLSHKAQAQIVRNAQAAGSARLAILEQAHLEPQLAPQEPVRSGWFGMGSEPAPRLSFRQVELCLERVELARGQIAEMLAKDLCVALPDDSHAVTTYALQLHTGRAPSGAPPRVWVRIIRHALTLTLTLTRTLTLTLTLTLTRCASATPSASRAASCATPRSSSSARSTLR